MLFMQVLKLINQNSCHTNHLIGAELGIGADGQVFSLQNEENKVIKFCVKFDYFDTSLKSDYQNIDKILSYIANKKPLAYAQVYEHDCLGEYSRDMYDGSKQKYILYYYVMEKLSKISEDEKKVFHSILSHEDRNAKKNFSILKIKEMLSGLRLGLDFSSEKIILFCENLNNVSISHNDIHPRNIMKDKNNNFKLIDFDRCTINKNANFNYYK
jgi:serine/threonine protein kinase